VVEYLLKIKFVVRPKVDFKKPDMRERCL